MDLTCVLYLQNLCSKVATERRPGYKEAYNEALYSHNDTQASPLALKGATVSHLHYCSLQVMQKSSFNGVIAAQGALHVCASSPFLLYVCVYVYMGVRTHTYIYTYIYIYLYFVAVLCVRGRPA